MIIAIFFLALIVTVSLINKKNGAAATDAVLEFERSDSLLIFACLISSILFQILVNKIKFLHDIRLPIAAGLGLAYACVLILVNLNREHKIQREHDQIIKVYQSLADIFGNVELESINFGDVPFKFEEDKKLKVINSIVIDTTKPGLKINDNSIIYAQYSLNKYFPELQWTSEHDAPNRQLIYKGLPKPPGIAHWPWSDYRPAGWIPLGLGGGPVEICWNMGGEKNIGMSEYVDDDGNTVKTKKMPSAPQSMVLGTTGGGKAIYLGQIVDML